MNKKFTETANTGFYFRRYLLAYLFGCRIYHRWNCADDAHYFPVHANDRSFVYRNRIYALYSKNS